MKEVSHVYKGGLWQPPVASLAAAPAATSIQMRRASLMKRRDSLDEPGNVVLLGFDIHGEPERPHRF